MKKRIFSIFLVATLLFMLFPAQTVSAEDLGRIRFSNVSLVMGDAGVLIPEITQDGTVFTFNDTKNADIESYLNGLGSSDAVKFRFKANVERFLYHETGTFWDYGDKSAGVRLGFMDKKAYDTDFNYVLFNFTLRDINGNNATRFAIRIKKWERQYQPREVAPNWSSGLFFVSTHQNGAKTVPWSAVPEKPHQKEYVAAKNVTFPYTVTVRCAMHYTTKAYLDGSRIFMPGANTLYEKVLTFTSNKTYYDFMIDPGSSLDSKYTTGVKSYWRISVTGAPGTPSIVAKPKVRSIKLSKSSMGLAVGRQLKLAVASVTPAKASKAVKWSSSNSKVLVVAANGRVTAKAKGTAYAIAKTSDGSNKTVRCKIRVYDKSRLVKYPKRYTLKSGRHATLKTAVLPKNAWQSVTYKSSNTAIATVNAKGRIIAKRPGKVKITVTTNDGMKKKAVMIVTVKK